MGQNHTYQSSFRSAFSMIEDYLRRIVGNSHAANSLDWNATPHGPIPSSKTTLIRRIIKANMGWLVERTLDRALAGENFAQTHAPSNDDRSGGRLAR